ncbi:hypothetical protein ABZ342_28005 [Amycolatopsis sp. NPDC005961]|uniref:hypothetical protein n=1 Tax=Amycolatopsis sp. NPDC005961 TaxID=3156720 RepID=UPI0033D3FC7B
MSTDAPGADRPSAAGDEFAIAAADLLRPFRPLLEPASAEPAPEPTRQLADSIGRAIDGFWPWVERTARASGKRVDELNRRAAPPNWVADGKAEVDYFAAVRLSLEQGVPLAWVPDPETVKLLLAAHGEDASASLHAVLDDRREVILDHCDHRLDEVDRAPSGSPSVRVAREAVQALRLDLPSPAQSVATNLIDELLRTAFTIVYGGRHDQVKTLSRVQTLSERAHSAGLSFLASLGILRELATVMPLLHAMTQWWPESRTPAPTTFSRHVTSHFITAPGQVTRTNALVAVLTAVSLLSQEHDSRWGTWKIMNAL